MTRLAVLVTGSRDWDDAARVIKVLSAYPKDTLFLHGACPTGVDAIVHDWCVRTGRRQWSLPYFDDLGKSGGPARNATLVAVLKALGEARLGTRSVAHVVVCEAFPIGVSRGTRGCVTLAMAAGIQTNVHEG